MSAENNILVLPKITDHMMTHQKTTKNDRTRSARDTDSISKHLQRTKF